MSKPLSIFNRQLSAALQKLANWYDRNHRILPWRDQPTLYRVWISEIMLQQTQVGTVVPYFERFITRFPKVVTLAEASEDEVIQYWAGLGYYARARNLHRAAKIIARNGFPKDRQTWLRLPGIGNYTTGAILSIALNQPEPILDGNVERVLSRVLREKCKNRLWKYSELFVTRAFEQKISPSVFNQALMELGATVCKPKGPSCSKCPFNKSCRCCQTGDPEHFPIRRKKQASLRIQEELHCVLAENDLVLLRKRAPGEWRAGLWDLLNRAELEEYIPTLSRSYRGKIQTQHIVTRHKITRTTHLWQTRAKNRLKKTPTGYTWCSLTSPQVAFGSAVRRTLQKLQKTFPEVLRSD